MKSDSLLKYNVHVSDVTVRIVFMRDLIIASTSLLHLQNTCPNLGFMFKL